MRRGRALDLLFLAWRRPSSGEDPVSPAPPVPRRRETPERVAEMGPETRKKHPKRPRPAPGASARRVGGRADDALVVPGIARGLARLALAASLSACVAACAPDLTIGVATTSSGGASTGGGGGGGAGGGTGATGGGAIGGTLRWAQWSDSTDDQRAYAAVSAGGSLYIAAESVDSSGVGVAQASIAEPGGFLSQPLAGTGPHRPLAMAAAPDGQVFIAGELMGTTSFDPPSDEAPESAGGSDCLVARVTPTFFDVKQIGTEGYSSCAGVATLASGALYVAGTFSATLDDVALSGTGSPVVSEGDDDVFVARFGTTGVPEIAWRFGDLFEQRAKAMGSDAAGRLYVLAEDSGTEGHGGVDLWLLVLSGDGHLTEERRYGTGDDETALALAVAPDGSTAFAGTLTEPLDLGAGALGGDTFVAAFDPSGAPRWSHGILDDDGVVTIGALLFDDEGNTFVGGSFTETMALGGESHVAKGASDGFVAKIRPDGAIAWTRTLVNGQAAAVRGLAFDGDGAIVAVGDFVGDLSLGGETVLSGTTGSDLFAMGFQP